MKQGIEIATTDVLGKKIEPKLVVGTYNGYGSGEIFDANAVSDLVDARISEIVNLAPEAFDTLGEIAEILNVKQDYISDLEQIRNGAYLGATSYLCPTEGIPYEDLSEGVLVLLDKANTAIQNHQDVSNKVNISDLSAVAFSGSYLDLSYLPTIPTRVSLLANDAGYLTQHQDISYKANRSELFSRDYNDLLNKPTIPVVPTNISSFNNDVGYLTQHQDISGLLQLIPDLETIRSGAALGATSIQEHLSLSDYLLKAAISDWAKLSTKPAYNLDEVTDGSTRKLSNYYTKELTESLIPTNVSAFTNDVPYLTAHQSISHLLPISGAFVDIEYKSKKFYKTKYNSSNNQVESEIVSASTLVDDGGGVKQANVSSSTPTLSWGATSKIGSVGSVDFSVKMPANPNTNTAGLYVIDKTNKKVSTVESPAQFILFTGGENKFSIKDHNNLSFDVNITPYIENCVTGSSLTNNTVILGGGDSTISSSGKQIQTSISNSNSYIPTSKAVVSYVTSQLASVLTYKGTIGTSDATVTELPATHKVGDVYVVSTVGTFAGKACEVGDYIICRIAGTVANDSHWDVVSGENQVDNKQASLASAGSSATIAAVDGTNITITTPSTWTGLTKTGTITKVGNTTSGIVTVSSGENTATYNGFCTVGTVGGIDLRFKMPAKPTLVASDIPDLSETYVALAGTQTITGGKTFSGTNASILTIDRNSTSSAWIKFAKNGTLSGYLGVSNDHKAMFHNGKTQYEIWHEGNFTPSDYLPLAGGTITGAITATGGVIGNASSATNIAGGTEGSIPYQTDSGTTAFLSGSSSNGYVLAYNTTTKAPYWKSDANTALRVYRQTTGYNDDYPLIASRTATIGTAGTNSSYSSVYGVISDTAENVPTVNPSTGLVKVKELNVSGDTVSSYGKVLFNGYGFVDLGLPSGNLWATCNIGASSQELIGLYFAWGDETGYAKGDGHNFNKAVSEFSDTVHVEMSALWEFPSPLDFMEIEHNCTKTWATINNISGYKFTSNQNGNAIFFPAGGYWNGTILDGENTRGRYWTNTASASLSGYATGFLFIYGTTYYANVYDIKWGFNVRGVVKPSRLSSILDNMYRINDLDNRVSDLE